MPREQAVPTALLEALRAQRGIELAPEVSPSLWWRALLGPVAQMVARPGKELRGRACVLGWQLAGGSGAPPDSLILAVEALHAGSLIVDDVEDDSDERRGAPALHRLVGAPLAINTGSWMYFWALSLLEDDRALSAAIHTLRACHQGQALDLALRIGELAAIDVPGVVAATTRLKTGALMGLATRLGAIAAGASREREASIGAVGEAIGIGLQMLDDLGSLIAPSRIAKGREDLRAGRPTWPWAWLAGADDLLWARLSQRAGALHAATDDGEVDTLASALRREIEPIGRLAIRAHLDDAVARAAVLGNVEALRIELARMEASYGC